MSASTDLVAAKKKLAESLGDTMIHLHNQFLLAILTKCHSVGAGVVPSHSSTGHSHNGSTGKPFKKTKGKKLSTQQPKVIYQQRFLPANPLSQAPEIQPHTPEPEERGLVSRAVSRALSL
ncbi:hypothetical protein NP493_237g01068 [Ridgeia piscesae]|uniref:Uncharacterized protein n=1 Tax=Ridgeia piscesae TaxID=27915 RepID=A0AAD9NZL8_RIDPI|nr:hypothetical protein NP493_237g01068 [Ridgeia piscesae]